METNSHFSAIGNEPQALSVEQFTAALVVREKQRQSQIYRNLGVADRDFVTPHIGHDRDRHLQTYVRRVARRIAVIDVKTRETWDGSESCGKALQCPAEQVRNACLRAQHNARKGHILPICRGRNLMYLRDYNKFHDRIGSLKRITQNNSRTVIDMEGGKTWPSVTECARDLEINAPEVFLACSRSLGYGRPAMCHGHRLMFLADFRKMAASVGL